MEDNTKRLDKTFDDLTLRDVIVVGVAFLVIKDCVKTARYMMAPKLIKFSKRMEAKSAKMKTDRENLQHGMYL